MSGKSFGHESIVAFILSYGKDLFVNDMYVHVIRHAVIVSSY